MNEEREMAPEKTMPQNTTQSDVGADQGESTLGALRGGFGGWTEWNEDEHTTTDVRECTDQHCMNVEVNCGFQGLVPDSPLSQSAAVSDDLRAAWREKLASEGKPTSGTQSIRDLIFRTSS